jgi:hypothetical protein
VEIQRFDFARAVRDARAVSCFVRSRAISCSTVSSALRPSAISEPVISSKSTFSVLDALDLRRAARTSSSVSAASSHEFTAVTTARSSLFWNFAVTLARLTCTTDSALRTSKQTTNRRKMS